MRLGLRDQEAKVADYLMAKNKQKRKGGWLITGEKMTGGIDVVGESAKSLSCLSYDAMVAASTQA